MASRKCPICQRSFAITGGRGGKNKTIPNHPTCQRYCKQIHAATQILLTRGPSKDGLIAELICALQEEDSSAVLSDEQRAALSDLGSRLFTAANKANAAGRRRRGRDTLTSVEKTRSGWRGSRTAKSKSKRADAAAQLAKKHADCPETLALIKALLK